MARTIVSVADAVAVDDGLPLQQLVLAHGAQALDTRLGWGLLLPGGELLEETLSRAA